MTKVGYTLSAAAVVVVVAASFYLFACSSGDNVLVPAIIFRPGVVSLDRTHWSVASFPEQLGARKIRGKMLWHNPSEVEIPGAYVAGTHGVPFRMIFRPNQPAAQIGDWNITDSSSHRWNGIMAPFDNQINMEKVTYLYIVAHSGTAVLHIDIGRINCDRNGNDRGDTEDRDYNGAVTTEEDLGLDGLADLDEPGYNRWTNRDPNGDNWFFEGYGNCPVAESLCARENLWDEPSDSFYYEWLNGTDGNRYDPAMMAYPDEERFGGNLNMPNAYFSFRVNLSSDTFLVPGSEVLGWRVYRIPIHDPLALDTAISTDYEWGPPTWAWVREMRLWMDGQAGAEFTADTVVIARMYFEY